MRVHNLSLLIEFDHRVHLARLGVTPSWQRKDGIFFCLLYRALAYACDAGAHQVHLGPTAYAIKKRIGASIEPLRNFILPHSTKWRLIMHTLKPIMEDELSELSSSTFLKLL